MGGFGSSLLASWGLGSWREYRRFQRLPAADRNLVFYAETGHDWHHFEPLVERLTGELGRVVCYVTSDPRDPALRCTSARLRSFLIPEGFWRIVFFQKLRCDVLVLTMMDLDCLELRRSLHPVHYVYVFHSLGSTHMVDHPTSYDHYDTLLCAGPHQMREIRRREELEGLPAKQLLAHGYARLEALQALPRPQRSGEPTVLIAPTWGPQSIFPVCGERLIGILLEAGYRVIARPHYHTSRSSPELVESIRQRYAAHPRFEFVGQMAESDSLLRSDLLISDWSAMALEYGLGLEKPVLFIDVPPRVRNPGYEKLGLEPVEVSIRRELGAVLDPAHLEDAPKRIEALLEQRESLRARAPRLREQHVFNPGQSAPAGARAIAAIAADCAGRGAAAR